VPKSAFENEEIKKLIENEIIPRIPANRGILVNA
jgi:hypothetical protein